MPLGFSKSVLTTAAAAPAASGFGAYRQTNALSTGNLAGHTIENVDFANNHDWSMVMWFRANGVDNDGDSDDWIDGVSGNGTGSRFLQMPSTSGNASGAIYLQFTLQDFGWSMQLRDQRNAEIDGRGYPSTNGLGNLTGAANTAAQAAHSFDGSWKCLMISLKADFDVDTNDIEAGADASDTDGDSTERAFQAVYVCDTDYTNMPNGHTRGFTKASQFTQGHMGFDNGTFSTTMTTDRNIGPGFHIGPFWVYNSFINFNTQSERRKFYNPSNTDGFVSPTNTGTTSAGATQPNLFFRWDGSQLVNGGSDSITLTKRTIGTGGGFTNITDGPGSGGTI